MTAIAPLTLCWWLSSAAPALTGDSGVDAAAVLAVGAQMFAQLADAASAGGALPLLILLWTGVVTCAVCCVAEAKALGTLSSSEATVIFATEPLWAVVFALLLLDETPRLGTAAGGLLIVGACLISSGAVPSAGVTARWARRIPKVAEPYVPFGFLPRLLLER